jgi:hypothetical protein
LKTFIHVGGIQMLPASKRAQTELRGGEGEEWLWTRCSKAPAMATTLLCARSSSLLVWNSSVSLRSFAPSLSFSSPHLHNQSHYCHFLSSFAFSGALGVRRFCPSSRRSVSSWWCRADLSTTAGVVEAEGVVVEEKREGDEENGNDDDDGFRGSVPAFQKRLRIADIKGGPQGGLERVGEYMLVRGWVRTCRSQKTFAFIEVRSSLSSCLSFFSPETRICLRAVNAC